MRARQRGRKHTLHMRALQGVESSTTLGMRLHTHLQSSSRHTLLQLNINGLQEALSCYSQSTPIKHSIMHAHIHTHSQSLPHLAELCFHSAQSYDCMTLACCVTCSRQDRICSSRRGNDALKTLSLEKHERVTVAEFTCHTRHV